MDTMGAITRNLAPKEAYGREGGADGGSRFPSLVFSVVSFAEPRGGDEP